MPNELQHSISVIDADFEDLESAAPQIENLMIALAQEVRQEFAQRDQGRVTFEIKITGDPHGELEVTYAVGNYGTDVKGNSIMAIIREFFRRKGWDNMHRAKRITATGEVK